MDCQDYSLMGPHQRSRAERTRAAQSPSSRGILAPPHPFGKTEEAVRKLRYTLVIGVYCDRGLGLWIPRFRGTDQCCASHRDHNRFPRLGSQTSPQGAGSLSGARFGTGAGSQHTTDGHTPPGSLRSTRDGNLRPRSSAARCHRPTPRGRHRSCVPPCTRR